MRLEGNQDGQLRAQGENHPGPRAVASSETARGVFFRRLCLCVACGSAATSTLGTIPKTGNKRMQCRKCGHRFVAAGP